MIGFCVVFCLWRGLHRLPRGDGHDGRKHRHQHDPDHRLADLLGDRHRLSPQPRRRLGRLHARSRRQADQRRAGQPTRTASRSRTEKPSDTTDYKVEQENGKQQTASIAAPTRASGVTQEPVDKDKPDGESRTPSSFTTRPPRLIAPHTFSFVIIQACIAILILVGFESVTSMGEEAKNAKRDIPRAVLAVAVHPGRGLLPDRVFCRRLFPQPRLQR